MARIAIIGDLNWDLVFRIPRFPERGGEVLSGEALLRLGGSAANTARFLAKLGVEARLFAAVGNDPLGEWARRELKAHGVSISFLQEIPTTTGICCVLVEEGGERTLLTSRGANVSLGPELPPGLLDGVDWLHISGYALLAPSSRAAVLAALTDARERKIPVSFDPGMVFAHHGSFHFWELFPVDVFLPNLEEAHALVGQKAEEEFLLAISPFGRRVFLKLGAQGVLAMEGEKIVLIPAIPVEVKDTLGAGDAFNAGVIVASLLGGSILAQAALGNVLGALTSAGLLPARENVNRLIHALPEKIRTELADLLPSLGL